MGDTGETVLAVQAAGEAYFITSTRLDPTIRFTEKRLFDEQHLSPIQRAARGDRATAITTDYRGKEVVATWAFIPRVDWGIVVKADLSEVNEPLKKNKRQLLIVCVIAALLMALLLILHFRQIRDLCARRFPRATQRAFRFSNLIILLLVISLYLLISSIVNLKRSSADSIRESQKMAMSEVKSGIDDVVADLEKIQALGNFIAQDLRSERLISEDIKARIKRELIESEAINGITIAYAPYAYDKKRKLYAPSINEVVYGHLVESQVENFL